mmetsp:Transcript_8226/g.13767  ORF Transcript_8226/g.13767 Transcript_8226/m.13767 type:complete len:424 (-) Transcript_8226:38-1309(-)
MNGCLIMQQTEQLSDLIKEDVYQYIPFELFFAITDSIKYIQVVYIAKWINRKYLTSIVGILFTSLGMSSWLTFYFIDLAPEATNTYFVKGMIQIVSGSLLLCFSIIQKYFCSMDPLDSNYILNEQCMNLISIYRLPQVKFVMLKSEFFQLVDKNIQKKDASGSSGNDFGSNNNTSMQKSNIDQIKKIKRDEEIDKVLSRSKSVSFNDLVQIRNVKKLILAAVCLTGNFLISHGFHKVKMKGDKHNVVLNVLNVDFLGGLLQIIIGLISASRFMTGKRMILIVLSCLLLTIWNIIWLSFTQLYDEESQDSTFASFGLFDKIMFYIESILAQALYYIIIISGPIDICKMYMLKENKRIFALLVCFIGGVKLGLQGLIFDQYISTLVDQNFLVQRLQAILCLSIALFSMIPMVKDEVGEIYRQIQY